MLTVCYIVRSKYLFYFRRLDWEIIHIIFCSLIKVHTVIILYINILESLIQLINNAYVYNGDYLIDYETDALIDKLQLNPP